MDFSEALKKIKKGEVLARKGWGENVFIFMFRFEEKGSLKTDPNAIRKSFICLNSPSCDLLPWNITQNDILAEDWAVIE